MGAVKEKYEGKFTGTSNDLDFKEALKKAIKDAQAASGVELVKWRLDNVTGESGGVTGEDILTDVTQSQTAP